MSVIISFFKKYRIEVMTIIVLLSIPVIEPVFEVIVQTLFTIGNVVGSWVRIITETRTFC